jgi:hypothetical protein
MFNKFKAARQERQWLAPLELKYAKGVYVPEAQAKILSSVVEYLQDKLSQEEEIFVLPHEGHYHFLLNKPSASRFDSALFAEVDPNYEKEVVEAIEKAKVRYIIYDRASYLVTDHNPVPNEKRIPEIVDYVLKNYTIIHQVEGTLVLERKGVS